MNSRKNIIQTIVLGILLLLIIIGVELFERYTGFKSAIIYFILLTLLLPIGIFLILFKRNQRRYLCLGIGFILIGMWPCYVMSEAYLWWFDALRGWELRLRVDVPPYTVTLVQQPGSDFYDTYFLVTRSDGRVAEVTIDVDDRRWWNPKTIQKDGKIYFVRDQGVIGSKTVYVDAENDSLFDRFSARKLSELDFEDPTLRDAYDR